MFLGPTRREDLKYLDMYAAPADNGAMQAGIVVREFGVKKGRDRNELRSTSLENAAEQTSCPPRYQAPRNGEKNRCIISDWS